MAGALVPARVPVEVELVVLLGGPPPARGRDLGDDGRGLPPLGADAGGDVPGHLLLLGAVVVDGAAVLGPAVGALTVEGGGVVGAVEEF